MAGILLAAFAIILVAVGDLQHRKLCAGPSRPPKKEFKPKIADVVRETQKGSDAPDEINMIWWLPTEFWQITFAQNPGMPEKAREEILAKLRRYVIIGACDGKLGTFGGATWATKAKIGPALRVVDGKGRTHQPLAEEQVNEDVLTMMEMTKPAMARVAGPIGRNIHFFYFALKDGEGKTQVIDARKQGSLSVKYRQHTFRWRLPLGSLLPAQKCPKCSEKLNGAFSYCPWCGTKLPRRDAGK